MNLKIANEMWLQLQLLYKLKNSTLVYLLLQKFFKYKMELEMSNVSTIEEMTRQFEDFGHK